jgi:methyltransferase (TIGR00027 family)
MCWPVDVTSKISCSRQSRRGSPYVIIGAGLDTFALRHPRLRDHLRVFEIEHPATQAFKRDRIAQARLTVPEHLQLVPADLERESVSTALTRTGFEPTLLTFFAWPGVALYLTHTSVMATLQSIADIAAPGGRLVFDYIEPAALASEAPMRIQFVVDQASRLGEPILSTLEPSRLQSALAGLGFHVEEDLGPSDIQNRILGSSSGFRAVERWHFVKAQRASS